MRHGAFAEVHELAVPPVRAHREIRRVILAGVEEVPQAADWETGLSKGPACYAEQEMTFVEEIASLVDPVAIGIFVSPAQRFDGNAEVGSITGGAECKLDEGEWEGVPGC